jgi:hypothetical protein
MMTQRLDIILALDANESIEGVQGKYCPLDYTIDKPVTPNGHDGSIATLIRTCGLCDPLRLQHTEGIPPTTYSKGTE